MMRMITRILSVFVLVFMMEAGSAAFIGHAAYAGGGGGAAVGGAEYVELDPLVLPIVGKNGVSQSVSLVVAIEVAKGGNSQKIRDMSPKLTDAYIQELYGMLNEHAALKGGVLQVGYIKKKLYMISKKVMGEDQVSDVLLQVVQQRPI